MKGTITSHWLIGNNDHLLSKQNKFFYNMFEKRADHLPTILIEYSRSTIHDN